MSNKTVIEWKLYYSDGSTCGCDVRYSENVWESCPSDNVQILIVYYQETYKIWRDGVEHEEHYRDMYFGKDYYWQYGNGQANDVPEDAAVKLGKELLQQDWRTVYNSALNDFPYNMTRGKSSRKETQ